MNWNFWETDDYSYPYLSSEQNWQQIKSDLLLAEKEQLLEFYTRSVGLSIIELGGGRIIPSQNLDLATGYSKFAQVGDFVDKTKLLAIVHYQDEDQFKIVEQRLLSSVKIGSQKPEILSPILLKI